MIILYSSNHRESEAEVEVLIEVEVEIEMNQKIKIRNFPTVFFLIRAAVFAKRVLLVKGVLTFYVLINVFNTCTGIQFFSPKSTLSDFQNDPNPAKRNTGIYD